MTSLALPESGVEGFLTVVTDATGLAGADLAHRYLVGAGLWFKDVHVTRLARIADTMNPVGKDGGREGLQVNPGGVLSKHD